MLSVAFVSAIPEELIDLKKNLRDYYFLSMGVGNLEAAIHLQDFLFKNPNIKEIIFIGSAGSYDIKICPVPSFASGFNYYSIEYSFLKKYSHIPELLKINYKPTIGPVGKKIIKKLNLKSYSVNCPNSISLQKWNWNMQNKIQPHPILENMECFGLASVCKKMNTKFCSIFSVTNSVCANGSVEWKKNYKILAKELNQKIIEILNT